MAKVVLLENGYLISYQIDESNSTFSLGTESGGAVHSSGITESSMSGMSISSDGAVTATEIVELETITYNNCTYAKVYEHTPSAGLFPTNSGLLTKGYVNQPYAFCVIGAIKGLAYVDSSKGYGFLVRQKATSSSAMNEYAWYQKNCPTESTTPGELTNISNFSYGLVCETNGSPAYLHRYNNGDWWAAIAPTQNLNGGTPGFDTSTIVTTGYTQLWVRIA